MRRKSSDLEDVEVFFYGRANMSGGGTKFGLRMLELT